MTPEQLNALVTPVNTDQATIAAKQAELDAAKSAALANAVALQEAVNAIVADLMPSTAAAPLDVTPPAA